ncbi:hypothetical protein CA984_28950 [Streptosporangium minutum]|uniref:Uncharacterized protein n=1 Tax=Streptosporangium minutum TaxID=569862 RepID=A0A243RDB3_9ACTN|nr:hypothetical protein CA984_28950 [Streptosporangium minutum]
MTVTRNPVPAAGAGTAGPLRPLGAVADAEPDGWAEPGELHLRSIVAGQLSLAGRTLAAVAGILLGVAVLPSLGEYAGIGAPGVWLVLCLVPPPLWALLAVTHLRRAERIERESVRAARDGG